MTVLQLLSSTPVSPDAAVEIVSAENKTLFFGKHKEIPSELFSRELFSFECRKVLCSYGVFYTTANMWIQLQP